MDLNDSIFDGIFGSLGSGSTRPAASPRYYQLTSPSDFTLEVKRELAIAVLAEKIYVRHLLDNPYESVAHCFLRAEEFVNARDRRFETNCPIPVVEPQYPVEEGQYCRATRDSDNDPNSPSTVWIRAIRTYGSSFDLYPLGYSGSSYSDTRTPDQVRKVSPPEFMSRSVTNPVDGLKQG